MNKGDIVKHRLSGEIFRVLKMNETIAVCQHPPTSEKFGWQWMEHDRYICQIENLELTDEGKEIFEWLDERDGGKYSKLFKEIIPGTQLQLI